MTFCGQWESTSTVTRNRFIVPVCPVCPVTKRSVMVNLPECISEIVCGWFMFENVCEEGLASQEQRSEEKVLTWQQDRKIMISLVCTWPLVCVGVCVFPSQGLGGLYHCDYPAAHDSEYKEDIDDPPPFNRNTHTHTHFITPSWFEYKPTVCCQACDRKLPSSDGIKDIHIAKHVLTVWLPLWRSQN